MAQVAEFLYSPSELHRGATFRVFFWMLAIAAILGHRAYAPILLAPLAAIDWRHAYYSRHATFRSVDRRWVAYFCAAGVFSIYTAVSALWSPLPMQADWALRLGACFLIAPVSFHSVGYLTPATRERAAAAVAWATLAMLLLLTFEAATNAAIRQALPPEETVARDFISLGRGTLLLVLLVWPARRIFAERLKRPWLGWLLVVAATYPALKFSIVTNAAMLAAGFIAYWAARAFGRSVAASIFAMAAVLIWATPMAAVMLDAQSAYEALPWLPDSWAQRLFIWERAGDAIAAHPFGGGVEYARAISRPIDAVSINGVALNTMPLHPHNLILHVWMDLGVVGALCLCGFLFAGWRGLSHVGDRHEDLATAAAVAAAILVTAMTEWSVWQVWRFAAVWIALMAIRLASGPAPASHFVRPGL